jgi:hypothetical protein
MNDQVHPENIQKEKATIKEHYEDSYWLKKYGVSSDELKQTGNTQGIRARIIQASFNDKALA